jgi:ribosomal protein S19
MCRSKWKLNYNDLFIFIRHKLNRKLIGPLITKNRHQPVYPYNINDILSIYDGKKYIKIRVENNKYFYHKFGEFSLPIIMSSLLHKKKLKSKSKGKKK